MPRIPVYTSRASAPGPIPGLGEKLAAPGRALERLGGAIVGFGAALARKAAREKAAAEEKERREKAAAEEARQKREEEENKGKWPDNAITLLGNRNPKEAEKPEAPEQAGKSGKVAAPRKQDVAFFIPDGANGVAPEEVENVKSQAMFDLADFLGSVNEDAELSVLRTGVLARATGAGDAGGLVERSLTEYDEAAVPRAKAIKDVSKRTKMEEQVQNHRAILRARALQRRNAGMVDVLNRRLDGALAGFADAVRQDTAVLMPMHKKGADAITESAKLAGLDAERVEAMQTGWSKQVHEALVEGVIARNPALAVRSLESGEMNARFGDDEVLIGRLTRRAERARDAAEVRQTREAKTRQSMFELKKAEHLGAVRKTGAGDAQFMALAEAQLDPAGMAALRDEEDEAEAHNAARDAYAFMTPKEIAADIEQKAPGGDLSDTDERARGDKTRKAARDEILAERKEDSAGWAMRDETVTAAYAEAAQAEEAAASPESGLAEAEQADRSFQRALALRKSVQKDMGENPRLLTEAEREALAEELAGLSPTERLARIAELKRRYGDDYEALAKELSGSIDRDAALLAANAGDAPLAGMLARGMEKAGETDKSAPAPRRSPPRDLPKINGKTDIGTLDPSHDYRISSGSGETVVRPQGNALVMVAGGIGERPAAPASGIAPTGEEAPDLEAQDPALPTGQEDDEQDIAGGEEPTTVEPEKKKADGSGVAYVRPSPVEAQRNKQKAVGKWQNLAELRKNFKIPGAWKELPKTSDGRIDRRALRDKQVYHVVGTDGVRSAWEWNEEKRAFMPFRRRTLAFSIDGMHELTGAQVKQTPDGRPIYNMEQDRMNAIVWGVDALFEVAGNPKADDSEPPQGPLVSGYAKATVLEHSETIDRLAEAYGVDPKLVKAILYREQAAAWVQPALDELRMGSTVSPMGVNPEIWGELVKKGSDFYDSATNIEAAISLIRRIEDRLEDPTPEKIATLYNSLAKEAVSDYGARVRRYYRKTPWLTPKGLKKADKPPKATGSGEKR